MAITTAKWAIADYHAMIAAGILDDQTVKPIHGEIIEVAPEGEPHAHYSREMRSMLRLK